MKNRSPLQSGVALVIVLGFLVLISVLVVAFFSSVTTELKASRNFSSGITTRQLSESATQIVMGQIRAATTRTHAAWGSQPGMIRTFRSSENYAGPDPDAFFKLYSSDKMVIQGSALMSEFSDPSRPDYVADWNKQPALWTDMNAPVIVQNSTPTTEHPGATVPRFPIIDPRAYAYGVPDRHTTDSNPDHMNTEGFWYGSDSSAPVVPQGIVPPGGRSDDQRLPMPVRWIYVLQDGTLSSPDTTTSSAMVAKWASTGSDSFKTPTKENPIIGRIAFWTDDESSKVNINTAGGYVDPTMDTNLVNSNYNYTTYAGSFWDTPRFYTEFDRGMPYKESLGTSGSNKAGTPLPGGGGLAICQLLQNEFQRYPGHPSTTSLGLILGPYLKTPSGPTTASPYTRSDQMYSVLPRLGITSNVGAAAGQTAGSTKGGMIRIIPYDPTVAENQTAKDLQINPKGDRLYASVDELYYAADSPDPANSSSYQRVTTDKWLQSSANPLPSNATALSADHVDKLRFFLTAQSRAPELNLFGFPRVTVWPVRFETATETSGLNPFDNVILFCSTIGVDPQANANGRPNTMKAPNQVQSPLQVGLSPAPSGANAGPPYRYIFTRRELPAANSSGNLPNPVGTWGGATTWLPDSDQPRNKQLMVYLQRLMGATIPGFGSSFGAKFGNSNRDQIIAEMFDYIRTANLQDTTTKTIGDTTAIQFSPRGTVVPSTIKYLGTKTYNGAGRFPVLNEASIVFYYGGPLMWRLADQPIGDEGADLGPQVKDQVKVNKDGFASGRYVRSFLVFSFFNPMQGYAPTKDPAPTDPKFTLDVSGMNNIAVSYLSDDGLTQISGGSFNYPANGTTKLYRSSGGSWGGRNFGGFEGFMHTLVGNIDVTPVMPHKIMEQDSAGALYPIITDPYQQNWISNGSSLTASNFTAAQQEWYPFQDRMTKDPTDTTGKRLLPGVMIPYKKQTMKVSAFNLDMKVSYGGQQIQKVTLKFPAAEFAPVPKGDPAYDGEPTRRLSLVGVNKKMEKAVAGTYPAASLDNLRPDSIPMKDNTNAYFDLRDTNNWSKVSVAWTTQNAGLFIQHMRRSYWDSIGSFYPAWTHGGAMPGGTEAQNLAFKSRLEGAWNFNTRLAWSLQTSYSPWRNSGNSVTLNSFRDRWKQIVQPGDTIRSLIYCKATNRAVTNSGDMRLAALPVDGEVPAGEYQEHPDYFAGWSRACSLRLAEGTPYFPIGSVGSPTPANIASTLDDALIGAKESTYGNHVFDLPGQMPATRAMGNLPWGANNAVQGGVKGIVRADSNTATGDFDTGIGNLPDGPYMNKPDEGNVIFAYKDPSTQEWRYPVPYFGTWAYEKPGNTFTSPSRQMPSPGMFGSLPSRALDRKGWETLSFSPVPAGDGHPGNTDPKDHLLLDLFQMPVVEPYPISEPFSSAGKINLNYQIQPFAYITRTTALRAALHPTRVTAVAPIYFATYKTGQANSGNTSGIDQYDVEKGSAKPLSTNFRMVLDRDATIRGFEEFFDEGRYNPDKGFFKSASQICERYLFPYNNGLNSNNAVKNWWRNQTLGGDNTREKPYVDLYPRVTTKSNTFTVHMRVQTLRQLPRATSTNFAQWEEGRDNILGEYRGSATIERYIDPADPRFDPTATNFVNPDDVLNDTNLETIYRFRTVITKKFTPY